MDQNGELVKPIQVSKETQKKLDELCTKKGLKTYDDAITHLFIRYENTEEAYADAQWDGR
jgi:hypothetical protein